MRNIKATNFLVMTLSAAFLTTSCSMIKEKNAKNDLNTDHTLLLIDNHSFNEFEFLIKDAKWISTKTENSCIDTLGISETDNIFFNLVFNKMDSEIIIFQPEYTKNVKNVKLMYPKYHNYSKIFEENGYILHKYSIQKKDMCRIRNIGILFDRKSKLNSITMPGSSSCFVRSCSYVER